VKAMAEKNNSVTVESALTNWVNYHVAVLPTAVCHAPFRIELYRH
jgi:hypothetical protein